MVLQCHFLLELIVLAIVEQLIILDGLHNLSALLYKEAIVILQIGPEHGHILAKTHKSLICRVDFFHEIVDRFLIVIEEIVQGGVISDTISFLLSKVNKLDSHVLLRQIYEI